MLLLISTGIALKKKKKKQKVINLLKSDTEEVLEKET